MELNDMKEWIIVLLAAAFIGAATGIVLVDFQEDMEVGDTTSVVNETVTMDSFGSGSVSQSELFLSVSSIQNTTDGNTISTSNYTVDSEGVINCSLRGSNTSCGYSVEVNYSHYTPTAQRNMTVNGLLGAYNVSAYFGTMGTIVGVAALIAIVLGAFYVIRR